MHEEPEFFALSQPILLVGFLVVKWRLDGIGFDEGFRRTVYNVVCAFPKAGTHRFGLDFANSRYAPAAR